MTEPEYPEPAGQEEPPPPPERDHADSDVHNVRVKTLLNDIPPSARTVKALRDRHRVIE